MIKGVIEPIRVKVTEADGASLTVATAVFEVFDTAGASVQAETNAVITDNISVAVTLSGEVDTTVAGFVIDSEYELLFTYTIGTQTKLKRVAFSVGEETGGAVSGNYISEDDVDNWPAGITDESKLFVIETAELEADRVTRDVFYEKPFDIFRDGNGQDWMALNLRGRILSVSAIYNQGVTMNTVNYSHSTNVIHRSATGIESDDYLRYLRNRRRRAGDAGLFPVGIGNLEIVGTMGWPEKLAYDTLVGTFRARETITGSNNTYTAKIQRVTPTALWIAGKTGAFEDNEVLTGGTSEATAAVNSASGEVTDPPNGIKQAAIMLAKFDNDGTLYTRYEEGSEGIAGVNVSNPRKPLTGIREVDRILRNYVRKIPRMEVV